MEAKAAQDRDAPQVEEAQQQAQPSDVSGQTMTRAGEILGRDFDYMSEGKYADAGKGLEALERSLSTQRKWSRHARIETDVSSIPDSEVVE